MRLSFLFFVMILAGCTSCPSGSTPVHSGVLGGQVTCAGSAPEPPQPSPSASHCDLACYRLAGAGCAEGGPHCVSVCEHVADSGITPLDIVCLATVEDKAGARACGVACP